MGWIFTLQKSLRDGSLKRARTRSLRSFNDHRDRVASTEAQGRESALRVAILHCVNESRQHARAAAADRVSERHGTPVYVELLVRNPQLPHDGDARRGVRLVVLEEVDVLDRHSGLLQELPNPGVRK